MINFLVSIFIYFVFLASASGQIITAEVIENQRSLSIIKTHLKNNLNSINGIEFVVAAPSSNSLASRWGHSGLRFLTNNSEDFVVSFIAETKGTINYLKGLSGQYPLMPKIEALNNWLENYIFIENRSINSIFLPSTKKQQRALLEVVKTMLEKSTESKNYYYFYGKNCTSFIFNILKKSGFHFIPDSTDFPELVSEVSLNLGLTAFPPRILFDIESHIIIGRRLMSPYLNNNDINWTQYSIHELKSILFYLKSLKSKTLLSKYEDYIYEANISNDIYSIDNLISKTPSFYNHFDTSNYLANISEKELKITWGRDELASFCFKTKRSKEILKNRVLLAENNSELKDSVKPMRETINIINSICKKTILGTLTK